MPAEPPDICAHCGADIHPNARACPQCGADESTGWEEDYAPDLGMDEDEFDYDEFVEREQAFIEGGGKLIFPLPEVEVYPAN